MFVIICYSVSHNIVFVSLWIYFCYNFISRNFDFLVTFISCLYISQLHHLYLAVLVPISCNFYFVSCYKCNYFNLFVIIF